MIEAVIFDWAGTTVDYGCMAPVEAFATSFKEYGIQVYEEEIRKPMGLAKIDHIRAMLSMPRIYDAFVQRYGRAYHEDDVKEIYAVFHQHLMMAISKHTHVKPYVIDCVRQLRDAGIKIGSTTGYTDEMMEVVRKDALAQGYEPDFWISPDGVGQQGRPAPYMIFANMAALHVDDVRKVVKVGDTLSDIAEGKHAGVFTIGVLEGSSLVGYCEEDFQRLKDEEKGRILSVAREAYQEAGADAIIMNLKELQTVLHKHFTK